MNSLRSFFHRTAAVLALATTAACSSSKKEDPTPAQTVTWTVDGGTVTASSYTTSPQSANNLVTVTGQVTAGAALTSQVMLDVPKAVGTYTFTPSAVASATYIARSSTQSQAYYAGANPGAGTITGAGTIVVTALTATTITGTFTFTGINTNTGDAKSVTNGTFNVGL